MTVPINSRTFEKENSVDKTHCSILFKFCFTELEGLTFHSTLVKQRTRWAYGTSLGNMCLTLCVPCNSYT